VNRSSLHTRSFRHIHFSIVRYRWTKNGFTGLKSFRGFWEMGLWHLKRKETPEKNSFSKDEIQQQAQSTNDTKSVANTLITVPLVLPSIYLLFCWCPLIKICMFITLISGLVKLQCLLYNTNTAMSVIYFIFDSSQQMCYLHVWLCHGRPNSISSVYAYIPQRLHWGLAGEIIHVSFLYGACRSSVTIHILWSINWITT